MEKKEKKEKRMSSLWIVIIGILLFYLPTLAVIFHYSKKGGLLYAVCFPLLIALPAILVIWRLSGAGSSGTTHDSADKTVTKTAEKDKSKDATKTVTKETSTSSGWGHFFKSPPFKIFLVAVSILTCILVLWALNIAAPQVKKTKETLKANGLLPDGSKSSSKIDLKTKKEEDRHIETMKRLEIQADLAKRVKTSTVFGTSYTTDEEKQQANDTKKPAETQTQTDQTSSTKQGKYPQQQQYVEYPNAVPLGATTLTK